MSPEKDFRERPKNYKMLPSKIKLEKKIYFKNWSSYLGSNVSVK